MAAAAHDADFAKRAGIDQSVAREFNAHDRRKKMAKKLDSRVERLGRGY